MLKVGDFLLHFVFFKSDDKSVLLNLQRVERWELGRGNTAPLRWRGGVGQSAHRPQGSLYGENLSTQAIQLV